MDDASTTEEHTSQVSTADEDTGDVQAPLLLYCVFGTPIFLTLIWFFLRFTRSDRFGRVDRAPEPAPEPEPPTTP